MAAVFELAPIPDGRYHGCGGLRADTLDLCDALTRFAIAEHRLDLFVENTDTAVEIAEQVIELMEGFAGKRRQFVLDVGQDLRDRTRARVMLLAIAKPRSSNRPRIWLTTAVR